MEDKSIVSYQVEYYYCNKCIGTLIFKPIDKKLADMYLGAENFKVFVNYTDGSSEEIRE